MNHTPARPNVNALMTLALATRLFWGMSLDVTGAQNAAWLCPVAGLILFLPFAFALKHASFARTGTMDGRLHLPGAAGFSLLYSLFLMYDAAANMRLLAGSANMIAMSDATVHVLILPLAVLTAYAARTGLDAAGKSALIWLRIFPLMALILFAVQFRSYETGWITPVFGGGADHILHGGIYCAGCMALFSVLQLCSAPAHGKNNYLRWIAYSALAASLLLAAFQMTYPAPVRTDISRAARIELILSNGRITVSPQLLLDLLWFGALLYVLAAETAGAAHFIRAVFKKLPVWPLSIGISLLVSAAAVWNFSWLQAAESVMQLAYPVLGGSFAVLLLLLYRKEEREHAQM